MELLGERTCFNIKREEGNTLFIIYREISRERNKFRTRPTDKYLEQMQTISIWQETKLPIQKVFNWNHRTQTEFIYQGSESLWNTMTRNRLVLGRENKWQLNWISSCKENIHY